MSDLQKLRESILAKAHQEGQAQLEKVKQIHEIEFNEQVEKLTREKELARQHLLDKEAHKLVRLEQQMANQGRQGNLMNRQHLIDTLFEGAVEQMTSWSGDTLQSFLLKILNQFKEQQVTLLFGDKTKDQLTSEQVESLQSMYSNVSVSEEVVANAAGFIIRDARVDYNFLFNQLVDSIRSEMSTQLVQQVFENQN
ncbi:MULTISPECIES: hypothetical protein [unclassified Facklamia]|uniref:hypothetical protein n=1 Tax=Aerococcaceae TaxID=186827 RepID=UPI0013B8F1D5|nr:MULTISPECIES: hypothetical protein [unclassified Facklamia]NEW64061.1 hypothetical protein [Facklamia sp. 252]NEW67518.1 hypothetical protein [Facklamia sp. 253]QQD65770.1 hypothetical protein JDW14_01215 [Aerococcaceae bacterium zg-252]